MLKSKLTTHLATEGIWFQSGVFFAELCGQFEELRKLGDKKKILESSIIQSVEAVIKHHTGLTVQFRVNDEGVGPQVNIPRVNKNHPLFDLPRRQWADDADVYKLFKETDGLLKGTVNLKNSMVTGVFSEILSIIDFPVEFFAQSKFTIEECAAIMLHEIGHIMTCYEYITRSVTTNFVLESLSFGLRKADSAEKKTTILVAAHKALKLKEQGLEELSQSTSNEAISAIVLVRTVEQSRAELGNNIYDQNAWEYLSDEFAARHGAGKHLITGLDKIYRSSWNKSFRGMGGYLAMEGLKILLFSTVFFVPFANVVSISVQMGMILIGMDSDSTMYDEPEARMRRIRQQIVEGLKDKRLNKEDVARMTEDLEVIDNLMSDVKDRRQLISVLIDWIVPSSRKNRAEILLQQELETIANNDLFAKSAALRFLK